MSDARESEPPGARRAAWLRLALLVGAVGALAALAALTLPHSPAGLRAAAGAAGAAGLVVAVVVWALVTPALFSGTVLALAAGLLFGPLKGAGVGVLGATVGGLLAFAIARRAGRGAVEALTGPRLDKILRKIERRGFVAVLAARLAPGMPATLLNYAAGLTRVRARHFAAAVAVGGAPRAFAYAAVGGSGGDLMSPVALTGFALLAALTLGGGGAAAWHARRRRRLA